MTTIIKPKRGLKANLPTNPNPNELYITTDTKQSFIANSAGNGYLSLNNNICPLPFASNQSSYDVMTWFNADGYQGNIGIIDLNQRLIYSSMSLKLQSTGFTAGTWYNTNIGVDLTDSYFTSIGASYVKTLKFAFVPVWISVNNTFCFAHFTIDSTGTQLKVRFSANVPSGACYVSNLTFTMNV